MKKVLTDLGLVALAAVLMSFGWYELTGLVMVVGLVPMLVLASRHGGSSARDFWAMFGYTMLFITFWYALCVWWVWHSTPLGPIAATVFAWIYTGLPFMLWFWISKRAPKPLSYILLIALWIIGEWIYNTNQASFPWLNIGNGFAHDIWAVQWYEWTGVYGGTLWVLALNVLVYEFLVVRWQQSRQNGSKLGWKNFIAPIAVLVLPIVVSLAIYFSYSEPARTAQVTLVQPNIDPYSEKFELPQESQTANLLDLAGRAPADAGFIVMPETAINEGLTEGRLEFSPSIDTLSKFMAARYPSTVLIVGATTYKLYGTPNGSEKPTKTARGDAERGFYDVYNTALAIDPRAERIDLHHKSKLVIGTEMMPDWWWMRYLDKLTVDLGGTTGQLGYDTVRKVFNAGEVRAGAVICYESIYGQYFTEFVKNGAEVLFVITNDGWWGNSPGHRQHFDYARLRAVETRRAVARSANTGRSGFITSRGDVRETLGWDLRGAISDKMTLNREITFYVRFGDWICRISLLVLGLGLLYFVAWKIRKRNNLV